MFYIKWEKMYKYVYKIKSFNQVTLLFLNCTLEDFLIVSNTKTKQNKTKTKQNKRHEHIYKYVCKFTMKLRGIKSVTVFV